MFCFREFKDEDTDKLISLVMEIEKFYPGINDWINKQIPKIKSKEMECILVDVDGNIAGCAISGVEKKSISTIKLKTFYIAEKYRGYAIGPYLLNKVLDFWIEKGYKKIFVTFAEEEVGLLLDYFKEYGFLLDGIFPFNYRENKSEYYMSKINIFESIDKNKFKDIMTNYLFRLRGYNILSQESEYCIVQKYVYIKEAYRTLVYFNTEEKNESSKIIKDVKELMRDNNCSTCIAVSYYPLEVFNERNIKLIDNYDIEAIFFPLNLKKGESSGFISTISKPYGDRILYDGKQAQLTPDKRSLRKEKVFYKYPNLPNIKRGHTFLFYESEPTKGIIGEGKVKEVIIDIPENLYTRFNVKGVLNLKDIEKFQSSSKQVLAISIGKFVKYKKVVSIEKIREIKRGFNPEGSCLVNDLEIKEIRKQGQYPYTYQ
ncbi:GNAT family N-acetyltransferase [archaeon AH-315-M20]|nr:GNAT family N-acetyltransferase [archaeon AH-315-M20]